MLERAKLPGFKETVGSLLGIDSAGQVREVSVVTTG